MSRGVDVLAIIRGCAMDFAEDGYEHLSEEMEQVANAVAGLILAVDQLERKAVEQARLTSSVYTSDIESVRAALARVRGSA